jgi:hypothetical protein
MGGGWLRRHVATDANAHADANDRRLASGIWASVRLASHRPTAVTVRETVFQSHIYIHTYAIFLPRQARDKHRESTQKADRFLADTYLGYYHMEEDYYNHTFNEIRKSCAGEYLDFSNSTTESIEPLRSAALHGVYSAYIYAEEAQRLLVRHKELYADQPIFMYLPFQVRGVRQNETSLSRCHSVLKMIILPRQARDKHRENSEKESDHSRIRVQTQKKTQETMPFSRTTNNT